jgi:uncharacterized OB-fold protein
MTEREYPTPAVNPETHPFIAAAAENKFLLRRCTTCGEPHWYPRSVCPFCFGKTAWEVASGEATIYSYSVTTLSGVAYAIAYVTLAEGPTMLTNLVDCDFGALSIGQPVMLAFRASQSGSFIPCFRPK